MPRLLVHQPAVHLVLDDRHEHDERDEPAKDMNHGQNDRERHGGPCVESRARMSANAADLLGAS
jgi:hypothetical protein